MKSRCPGFKTRNTFALADLAVGCAGQWKVSAVRWDVWDVR